MEKLVKVDQIEVISSGCVQVRTATTITEDGAVIGQSFHRHVIAPGRDYSSEDTRVQAICAVAHTADVVSAYEAAQAAKGV